MRLPLPSLNVPIVVQRFCITEFARNAVITAENWLLKQPKPKLDSNNRVTRDNQE